MQQVLTWVDRRGEAGCSLGVFENPGGKFASRSSPSEGPTHFRPLSLAIFADGRFSIRRRASS
eukprot:9303435-Pyramimonas_sp.AAC.1